MPPDLAFHAYVGDVTVHVCDVIGGELVFPDAPGDPPASADPQPAGP